VSILYSLKSIPSHLWTLLKWQFTCRVVVFNEDSAFEAVSAWLSKHEGLRRTRQLRLTSAHSRDEDESQIVLTPGFGKHLLWRAGRPMLIHRYLPDEKAAQSSHSRRENIEILLLGRDPTPVRELIVEIANAQHSRDTHVEVFLYRNYWRFACRKVNRSLDSVVLPDQQRRRIVADLDHFIASRAWYADRGIPYRRGILLHGPPGCGKTSLVVALASHFGRRVYALNLGSIEGDNELIDAVSSVPESAILLIEDIDAAQADRRGPSKIGDKQPQPLTMSGLLNVLDGVFSRDGRILVMTTNHEDKIDAALKRPGRADIIERIGEIGASEVWSMCAMFGMHDEAERIPTPVTPSEVQRRLIERSAA
jgi:chaperone BCS1